MCSKETWDKLPKWFRWLVNRIDDPFDNFKHWWRGKHEWFGMCFECDAYMKNRPGSKWSIRRIDCGED